MITINEYNFPLTVSEGFYYGKTVPEFDMYYSTYHLDFMRYLYYLCCMNAVGEFPINITLKQIEKIFYDVNFKEKDCCNKMIKMIAIGEAPPPNYENYFYNTQSPWNHISGRPSTHEQIAWIGAIQTALFPSIYFANKIDFLKACAKKGFLLIDMFPFSIKFSGNMRKTKKYNNACISAFGGLTPYPNNILTFLNKIKCCINDKFSVAFCLKTTGEKVLADYTCTTAFNTWLAANGKSLVPFGAIEIIRLIPAPVPFASEFLRVCGRRGLFGPCPVLLNISGII
jgi:hypothetical protein